MAKKTTTPNPNNVNNPTKEIISKNRGYAPDAPGQAGPNVPPTTTTTTTTDTPIDNIDIHSIIPASGFYGENWPQKLVLPQSASSAGWTDEAKGVPQQTFLGASIRSFTMNGGFGDSSSSLTVDLVVDEYNPSDKTPAGQGDDIYHSGTTPFQGYKIGDKFVPPIPGSPVFFKFGPNFATVEQAYRKTFDDLYYYNTLSNDEAGTSDGSITLDDFLQGEGVTLSSDSYIKLDNENIVKELSSSNREIKNYSTFRNSDSRGRDHIVFGGILQTYNQSRNSNGNPLYTAQVIDPREILSNVTIILNDYSGPTYGQKNILNLYGFLEYNATEATKNGIKSQLSFENPIKKELQKSGPNIGKFKIVGDDRYYKMPPPTGAIQAKKDEITAKEDLIDQEKSKVVNYRMNGDFIGANASFNAITTFSNDIITLKRELVTIENSSRPYFPMTGTGFSRRGPQGIPYYRVKDAINALLENQFSLPQEYKNQGFGGAINFRGYNYIIDFGTLPELDYFYYLDFDQINLLELALEICDITNRDLFVSLLPVINHPACSFVYQKNQSANNKTLIAGIIRLDTIDRSDQPLYGSVKTYIDDLKNKGIYVENQDLGYELSNVITDKFVVGAQEIGMYYFSANNDRDSLAIRQTGRNDSFPGKPPGYQWTLECALNQQILPYYGKLGNAVTIPKGFGAYQQILLDSSHVNAAGVGAYYVATEMELRCASISYDRWKEFLKLYNDVYMDSIESDDTFDKAIVGLTAAPTDKDPPPPVDISDKYVVSVPRSVFDTYALPVNGKLYGDDGLPLSTCNPPYGYPLYYKRMTKIGIPEAGLTDLYNRWVTLTTNLAELQGSSKQDVKGILNSQWTRLKQLKETVGLTTFEQEYLNELEQIIKDPTPRQIQDTVALMENNLTAGSKNVFPLMGTLAKKNTQNALKVYAFVKAVADECLGKKFLVRIPSKVNLFFDNAIRSEDPNIQKYTRGPFGFPPRSINNTPGYESSPEFQSQVEEARGNTDNNIHMVENFLNPEHDDAQDPFVGGLAINYNPILEKYESNYIPTNIGGYFSYDLYQNTLGASNIRDLNNINSNALPSGVKQLLIPQDPTNFIGEDGRISPYVRFDHSQYLALEGFSDADYSQQLITANGMIPDLSEHLDNTGPDKFYSFPKDNEPNNDSDKDDRSRIPKIDQVLFVKCTVDEQLYMPPKIVKREMSVHGQLVKDIGTKSLPQKVYIPCKELKNGVLVDGSGTYVDSYTYYKANFVPLPIGGGGGGKVLDFERYIPEESPGGRIIGNSALIATETDQLDTRFAYALITLPNKVVPTKDARLRDGPNQSVATERFKHLMTMDVVRGLPGFNSPTDSDNMGPPTSPLRDVLQKAEPDSKVHAWLAMKKAQQSFSFGFPYKINVTAPSPVYPDLVSLPLLAKDRCYGPWVSSNIDGQANYLKDIGGRVDFIKDENLSPWNYGGYDLLDKAGRLQAEFANSLLLFSERGSFTMAAIPSGNSLCKALMLGGPLVTSINVDISDRECRTTYQMDLYTASFGKLQKQKQELISKISRDRKRLISERNALIRKGLGKNQNRRNFANEYSAISRGSMPIGDMGLGMVNAYTRIVASVESNPQNMWSSIPGVNGGDTFGSTGRGSDMETTTYSIAATVQQDSDIAKGAQLITDQFALADKYQNAGSAEISDIWVPTSYGYHPNMSYKPFRFEDASDDLYTDRSEG